MRMNTNKYNFKSDYIEIITTKNHVILIDKDDFEKCKQVSWCVDSKGYANGKSKTFGTIRLHRYILNPNKNLQVDHINRNKLDNRKSNLRTVTNQQNHFNRPLNKNNKSGVTGVYFNNQCKKWCAQITINRKTISAGLFEKLEDAVKARNKLKEKYFQ